MKKIIASAVVAAATLSASQAAVFNGYSAGLTAGSLTSKNIEKSGDSKEKMNKTFGTYGVHFDYDRSAANAFYWGLGLDFMFFSGKKAKTFDDVKSTAKYSWSSELDARFGYNFCNNAAAFGLAGIRLYRKEFKAFDVEENKALFKSDKTRFAPVIGAGVKAKVTNNVSLSAEYRYAFERKETHNYPEASKAKYKQNSHAVLAKASYHF